MKNSAVFGILLLCFVALVAADDIATSAEEVNKHISFNKSGDILLTSEIKVSCKECSMVGDLSFSGGCDDTKASAPTCIKQWEPNANFSMLPVDFEKYWLGVAFDDFKLHIELDISLTPTNTSNELLIPLLGLEGISIPFNTGGPFSTVFAFAPLIKGWVNSTKAVSFTYGFDFTIPPHSALWIPVLHLNETSAFGFNQSTFNPTPFKSNDPDLQFDLELSFVPYIMAKASFVGNVFSETVYLESQIPRVNLGVSQARNVINDCQTAPANTDPTRVYNNLTHIAPSLSMDFGFFIGLDDTTVFDATTATALPTQCLAFDAKSTSLIAASDANANANANSKSKSGAGFVGPTCLTMVLGIALGFVFLTGG